MTETVVTATSPFGRVRCFDATYATARSGSGTFQVGTGILIAGQVFATPTYGCHEAFLTFDTSVIPDTDYVYQVTLSLQGGFNDGRGTAHTLEVYMDTGWTAGGLTSADFIAGASLGALTLVASAPSSAWVLDSYFDLTSEAAFRPNINVSGNTDLILVSDRLRLGTTPTGDEYQQFHRPGDTGQEPKLTILHTSLTNAPETLRTVTSPMRW